MQECAEKDQLGSRMWQPLLGGHEASQRSAESESQGQGLGRKGTNVGLQGKNAEGKLSRREVPNLCVRL